jgi:reactive intermediate/imine deaminase
MEEAMTDIEHFLVEGAPVPVAPYSDAVRVGRWVFLTGQLPIDPRNPRAQVPEGVEAQTRKVMENLAAVLGATGGHFADVVSARVFLRQFDRDYERMNKVYASYFEAGKLPARTCVGVTGLARGCLVEIDFLVHLGEGAAR